MGFLDKLLTKAKLKLSPKSSADEYSAKRDAERIFLEAKYDLNSLEGVASIPVPKEKAPLSSQSVTGRLEYYLHFKAYKHAEDNRLDLAIACLKKSNELKLVSDCTYRKSDYLRLPKLMREYKLFKEADSEEEKINMLFKEFIDDNFVDYGILLKDKAFSDAKDFKTDLLIMSVHGCTCEECARYQGRVFSISGNSKKYPRIPSTFFTYGGIHKGCKHTFFPYIDGVNDPNLMYTVSVHGLEDKVYTVDIVAFSNRPFVDDRSEEVKKKSIDYHLRLEQEHLLSIQRENDRKDYRWIQEMLPEISPKSFGAYRRMRSSNSIGFLRLSEEANKLGKKIADS